MCKKNEKNFIKNIDFQKITPKMQIEYLKQGKLYRKAVWENDKNAESEHSKNTRTWDRA